MRAAEGDEIGFGAAFVRSRRESHPHGAGRWLASDIVFQPEPTNPEALEPLAFEGILAHELGHVMGFSHVPGDLPWWIIQVPTTRPWPEDESQHAQLAYQVGPNVRYPGLTPPSSLSNDATLRRLELVARPADYHLTGLVYLLGLIPAFDSAIQSYTATAPNDATDVALTARANNDNATVTVNGVALSRGGESDPIDLEVGENVFFEVVVTAQDGTTMLTYTAEVARSGGVGVPPTNARECPAGSPTWMDLPVCEEGARVSYDRDAFGSAYSSLEDEIIDALPKSDGQVYTPYTCTLFDIQADGTAATDIEHIVALAEAYDSGLAESQFRTFAGDIDNLTIADPTVNRHQKSDLDAGEWEPPENRGWFAARIVAVKQKYGLSVNPDERDALQAMLNSAPSRTVSCGDGLTSGGPTYYFPHLAVGASWQTTITYINYSREEVTCQTDFISDHGTPLMVSFAELGTVVSRADVLPPGGSVHQETNVELSAPLAPGWARANCTGPVQASLLYRQHNSEGVPVAEAGVNAAAVPATRFVTFAEQGEGQFGTGVAYANPSDTAALVTFTARDADGEVLAIEDLMLPPNWHGAQNMPPLFDLSSFTGSLEVTSTEPIVSLSLNFEAAPVFSSLPPGELGASAQGSTTYYFPHLAVGASWQTTITYINYSREEVTCQTDFISDHGSLLMVSFAELGMVDSRTDVLPPGGSVHQETDVDLSAPLAPGWARANCSGPVKASLLYRQHNSEGVPVAEAGVNAATVPATRFVTFAEQGEGKNGTGVAYANPSDTAALVTFTSRDADGEVLAIEDLMLPPNWHGAQNMPPLFDLSSFTGSVEVTSTEPIVSLSINAEADPVFSSLPPGELDAVVQ